jgi:hypothetical protein
MEGTGDLSSRPQIFVPWYGEATTSDLAKPQGKAREDEERHRKKKKRR